MQETPQVIRQVTMQGDGHGVSVIQGSVRLAGNMGKTGAMMGFLFRIFLV
jgi:hypothetical protein